MNNKLILIFIFGFQLVTVHSADTGQYLEGTLPEDQVKPEELFKKVKKNSPFVTDIELESSVPSSDVDSAFIPGKNELEESLLRESKQHEMLSSGIPLPDKMANSQSYLQFKNKDLIDSFRPLRKHSIGFYFLADEFTYDNKTNNFEKTYRTGIDSGPGLQLLVQYERFFNYSALSFFGGTTFGAGYNRGVASFANSSEVSETTFVLWTFPLDLFLGAELSLGRYIKLAGSGGPSALGLWQVRDDVLPEDDRKYRRQMGYGLAASAQLKLSWSYWFHRSAINQFSSQKITQSYFNFFTRYQNYENFKEEGIAISGLSYGLGLSYDYR